MHCVQKLKKRDFFVNKTMVKGNLKPKTPVLVIELEEYLARNPTETVSKAVGVIAEKNGVNENTLRRGFYIHKSKTTETMKSHCSKKLTLAQETALVGVIQAFNRFNSPLTTSRLVDLIRKWITCSKILERKNRRHFLQNRKTNIKEKNSTNKFAAYR